MTLYGGDQHAKGPDLRRIGPVGRLLVTSDATLTMSLEQVMGEPIVLSHLARSDAAEPHDAEAGGLAPHSLAGPVTHRSAHLVGAVSGDTYVRARTSIVMDRLPSAVRVGLTTTEEPIGRLLRRHRVESFREVVGWQLHQPDPTQFGVDALEAAREAVNVSRRVLLSIGGAPALLIDEHFTAACFGPRRDVD